VGEAPRRRGLDWRTAAFAVSALSSPYVVAGLTTCLVVASLHPGWRALLVWAGVGVASTAVLPFLYVALLWASGRVTDIHVSLREQRSGPFLVTVLGAGAGVWALRALAAPPPLLALAVAFVANAAVLAAITLRWKISIHAATLVGCAVSLAMVVSPWYLAALAALPAVFWARMQRGRHTLMQGVVPTLLVSIITPGVYYGALAVMH
jgi:hypothetical protein